MRTVEKEKSESFFDSLVNSINRLWYGLPKDKKSKERQLKLNRTNPEHTGNLGSLPAASEEDLNSVLHVINIDLNIAENTKAHRTDKYSCTKSREVNGELEEPDLVLRRGQEFKVTVSFSRPYNVENDDLKFVFKTGKLATTKAETHGSFTLDESGKGKVFCNKWSGNLVKRDGNSLDIEVHIAANCAIGEWSVTVMTQTKERNRVLEYEHPDDFFILFNPWCKDDITYIGSEENGVEEYVLNDHGCVYRGNAYHPKPKEWNFGQFEDGILDACLFIIKKCLKPRQLHQLADPIKVSRIIAQVVNCNDADKGVLYGRWDGKYEDGDSPMNWYGSVRILRKYMDTGKPVKYGQCWVFSGVTTTVCRAVGLPARSVTNYGSAHDTDESNTIDVYYTRDDNGELVRDRSSDSIWNYHVWNEVWMKRPDIIAPGADKGLFDGWQAIDATPQERSAGVYTCGPCPVYAIKNGLVNVPYDASFIFSEVNADEIHWEPTAEGYRRFKISTDKVGQSISTKKATGKPYDRNAWFDRSRYDVNSSYKYDEGTEENRRAVMRAALGAKNQKEAYADVGDKVDVEFKLLHDADLPLGKDVDVKLTALNKSEYRRTVTLVTFRFIRQSYTGDVASHPFKVHNIKQDIEVKHGKEHEFKFTLKHEDYLPNIDDGRCMSIQAYALVEATRSRPLQNCVKAHVIEFGAPALEVDLPSSARQGEEIEAVVTFNNPLEEELTDCKAGYEGRGFEHVTGVPQPNVPALGTFKATFKMTPQMDGVFTLTFKFTSKQLHFLSGSASVEVH